MATPRRSAEPVSARFVERDAVVAVTWPETAAMLGGAGSAMFSRLAEAAAVDESTVRLLLRSGERAALSNAFNVSAGTPQELTGAVLIPTLWRATGPRGLFHTMEADVRAAPTAGGETRLHLQGRYTPPLREVGSWLDDVFLHRLVEASIDRVIAGLAR